MSPSTILPKPPSEEPAIKERVIKEIATNSQSSLEHWSSIAEPSLLHRSLHERPIVALSASKHLITLQNGATILDACGGAAVAAIGHGNQEVIAAMTAQAQSAAYVHTLTYTTSSAEELAKLLVGHKPGGLSKAFFLCSGSEANDGAMKLARQYFFEAGEKSRTHFIARRQGYHGNTMGAMSLSHNVSRLVPYKDILMPNVSHVSPCFAYHYQGGDESEAEYVARLAAELDAEFERVGPANVVAFVAETVGGATAGCITAVPGYFAAIKAVCRKHGALFMLDEIMCGMGRTGTMMAWEQEEGDCSPDIMVVGKGLGGGYAPIAAILVHEDVVAQLHRGTGSFVHGHTYQAHPVSCAVGLAVQTIVKREGLVERCKELGLVLEKSLKQKLAHLEHVGDIRGKGLFWAVEFVKDKASKMPFDPKLKIGSSIQRQTLDLGVAIYPGSGTYDGVSGDHVLVAPPYTFSEAEIEMTTDAMLQAYNMVVGQV